MWKLNKILKLSPVFMLLLLLSERNIAQTIIQMVDTTNQWNVSYHFNDEDDNIITPHDFWYNYTYRIEDTLQILNHSYRKLVYYKDSAFNQKHFDKYIREENGKVYFTDSIIEIIAYDFNMRAGDSLIIPYFAYPPFQLKDWRSYVVKVDSVYDITFNGILKSKALNIKVFPYYNGTYYKENWVEDTWVEGLGSLKYGLIPEDFYNLHFSTGGGGSTPYLLCFHNNNQLIYQNPDFNTCTKYHPDDYVEQHLISEDKKWTTVSTNTQTGAKTSTPYIFSYYTKINGIKYNRLYKKIGESIMNWPMQSLWYEKNDSVFKLNSDTGKRNLIYNFNMQEGDSFLIAGTQNYFLVADSVRNKFWGGKDRKHIFLHSTLYPNITTTWIYGVGQLGDFTNSTNAGLSKSEVSLLCFEENGELAYQNPEYKSCSVNTSVPKIKSKKQLINLFVSNDGLLHIQLINDNSGYFYLYSIGGEQVSMEKINNSKKLICSPSNGLLLYRFENEKGEVQTGKVLVH